MESKQVLGSVRLAFTSLAAIMLIPAASMAQSIDIPLVVTSGQGPSSWVSANYAHQFEADVDDVKGHDGEMSRDSLLAVAGHRFDLSDDVFLVTQGAYIMNNYHFTRSAGTYLWDDIHQITLFGLAGWKLNDKWTLLGGGVVRTSAEGGADFGEGFNGGGVFGVDYTWSETLRTGALIGVMSSIESSVGILPIPTVEWDISDAWHFSFGVVAMTQPGIGPEILWHVNDKLDIALAGSYQVRRFRLDSRKDTTCGNRAGCSNKGVGQETSFPIFARFGYKPTEKSAIDFFAGVTTGGNVQVEDKDGHKLKSDDYETAGFLGIKASFLF